MVTFSVIIPTYNREAVIARAIESVLKQTYKFYEVIVVDDASTDSTNEIVSKYPEVKYIKHSINMNGACARNTGIEAASNDYIAFLDSDDVWLINKLELVSQFIIKNKKLEGVFDFRH